MQRPDAETFIHAVIPRAPGRTPGFGAQDDRVDNGDPFDDLAVGVDGEAVGSVAAAGSVQVIYGSPAGLSTSLNALLHQACGDVEVDAEADDRFGWALAAGDIDRDGYDDLGIAVPFEDVGSPAVANPGAVSVIRGSATGMTADGDQLWAQDDTPDISSTGETDERFGLALAATRTRKLLFVNELEQGSAAAWSATSP